MDVKLIKAVSDEDLAEISVCAEEIWNEYYKSILSKDQIDYMISKFQSAEHMKTQILKEGYEYYKLTDDENLLGYMGIKNEGDKLFLSKLYIKEEYRKKGISKIAFSFINEYSKKNNLKGIYLTVNKNNLNSIEVYKHFGFEITKEEKTDIGSGYYMDDYIMEYTIDNSRIAVISIIVEDKKSVPELNELLSFYGDYIIGRMGVPYHKKDVAVISVALDAPNDIINTLSGKLGSLNGVKTKTVYSNK